MKDYNRKIDEVKTDGTIILHHTEEVAVDELIDVFETGDVMIDSQSGIITHVNKDVQHFSKSIFKHKFHFYDFLQCYRKRQRHFMIQRGRSWMLSGLLRTSRKSGLILAF